MLCGLSCAAACRSETVCNVAATTNFHYYFDSFQHKHSLRKTRFSSTNFANQPKEAMKITHLNAQAAGHALKRLMNEYDPFHWAVAWATDTSLSATLLQSRQKIAQLVIGIDFDHTSPKLLRALMPIKAAHVATSAPEPRFTPRSMALFLIIRWRYWWAAATSPMLARTATKKRRYCSKARCRTNRCKCC